MNIIEKNGLKISSTLYEFINNEAIPGTKVKPDEFWDKFSKIVQDNGFLSLFRRSRGRDINASCGSLANKKAIGNG